MSSRKILPAGSRHKVLLTTRVVACTFLAACAHHKARPSAQPIPVSQFGPADQIPSEAQRSFFADRRAFRPGDVLTVLITEASSVSATAQTTTNKNEAASANVTTKSGRGYSVGAGFDGKSAGGGEVARSDTLVAKLAVVVQSVDDRGNLSIRGEQDIEVNNEKQRIRLDGVVRREDIGPDNTVPSWRVGSAQIEFTGKGILASKQSPGLLNRILSWFWE
jgi:flagellar L-ring protein FlgH